MDWRGSGVLFIRMKCWGEMSSDKDPKAMAPERRKSGQEDLYRTGSTIALLIQSLDLLWSA